MVLLSPTKLMVILVVALIVLGPDKLPGMAHRVGALWSDFHRWRASVEREVRDSFPDLPSTTELARVVRSPLTLLDKLAEGAARGVVVPPETQRAGSGPPIGARQPTGASAPAPALPPTRGEAPDDGDPAASGLDVPSLN